MIKVISYTKKPLNEIGRIAGLCWGANVDNEDNNRKRALKCIDSQHGRVLEFAEVTLEISGYSARVMRELYTHIIGTSRLQESTRYVNCSNFEYYKPQCILDESKNIKMANIYNKAMEDICNAYEQLISAGMSKEDSANILPLGMYSKMILKINLRALIHLFNERLCYRAYEEMRYMMYDIKRTLASLEDDEWIAIINKYAVPKCMVTGYCKEEHQCSHKIRPKEC